MTTEERNAMREQLFGFAGGEHMGGQIHTPKKIVLEMLDSLPESVWNSTTTFLDPATKSGVFLLEIYKRLMNSSDLLEKFPDPDDREQHILQNQLFGIATDELGEMFIRRMMYLDSDINNIVYLKDYVRRYYKGSWNLKEDLEKELGREVKFDVVIGNPPYNDEFDNGGGTGKRAMALYPAFIEKAQRLSKYVSMITPTRWYTQPEFKGIRDKMVNGSLVSLTDYLKSSDCFQDVSIAGGVSYWLWDRDYKGTTKFKSGADEWEVDLRNSNIVLRYKYACNIASKIGKQDKMFDTIVSGTDLFGVKREKFEGSTTPDNTNNILLKHSRGEFEYISKDKVTKRSEAVGKYKLYTEYMNGSGDKVLKTLNILNQNEICDLSFVVIAIEEDKNRIENIKTYFETKFVRFLIKATLTNTTVTRGNYCLVPLQDFSKPWTDAELYSKYSLSDDEIKYIESTIKPME